MTMTVDLRARIEADWTRILLVEDHQLVAETLRSALGSHGFDVALSSCVTAATNLPSRAPCACQPYGSQRLRMPRSMIVAVASRVAVAAWMASSVSSRPPTVRATVAISARSLSSSPDSPVSRTVAKFQPRPRVASNVAASGAVISKVAVLVCLK